MSLPPDLLHAVSAPGGGKISIVLGAGCSVEAPTSVPLTRQCSEEIHRQLVDDGVLQDGDCSDPTDLSCLADAVYAKTGSQRDVVERFSSQYDLKLATPNDGYLLVAAMLYERVVTSVVTLNFDLALTTALGTVGAGHTVGVIECPDNLSQQKTVNVYYLHRNVNAPDPESWVLRTAALKHEWKDHWEPIIAHKVLTAPVVVFAGLGTPMAVLIESTMLLRNSLPAGIKLYQVDPSDQADSKFFQQLAIDSSCYIQCGWCQFMAELSQRLVKEHIAQLRHAVEQKVQEDKLQAEEVTALFARLETLGLFKLGKLRAHWLLHDKPYCPHETGNAGLMADLLLALGMIARISATAAVIIEDGLVEFCRDGRIVAVYLVASGRGCRGKASMEAAIASRRVQYRSRPTPPSGVIVGGTSDNWNTTITAPEDVIQGDVCRGDIIDGPAALPLVHINELRTNPGRILEVVP